MVNSPIWFILLIANSLQNYHYLSLGKNLSPTWNVETLSKLNDEAVIQGSKRTIISDINILYLRVSGPQAKFVIEVATRGATIIFPAIKSGTTIPSIDTTANAVAIEAEDSDIEGAISVEDYLTLKKPFDGDGYF